MLTLVIGNKELSSWSLRPWLILKHYGLPFSEIKLPLDTPGFFAQIVKYTSAPRAAGLPTRCGRRSSEIRRPLDTPEFFAQIVKYTPARRVPVLLDGEAKIWDSLAIVEYLNEKLGGRAWPADPLLRAHARSVSAEMHSGFMTLRQTWPMHSTGSNPHVPLSPEGRADVARVPASWAGCRQDDTGA